MKSTQIPRPVRDLRVRGGLALAVLVALVLSGCAATDTRVRSDAREDAASTVAERPARAETLTPEEVELHAASFDQVWETIRDKHWDPDLNGQDWEAVRDELRPEVLTARSDREARAVMRKMLSRLGQSHFGIFPKELYEEDDRETAHEDEMEGTDAGSDSSGSPDTASGSVSDTSDRSVAGETSGDEEDPEDGEPGLVVRYLHGQVLVTEVWPDYPVADLGVRPGWEIVSIDGWTVDRATERLEDVDERHRALAVASIAESRLTTSTDDTVPVTFRDGEGRLVELEVPMGPLRGDVTKFGNMPEMRVWFDSGRVDGDIATMSFNMFMNPMKLMPSVQRTLESSMDAEGFIIDLRGNPGGLGALAMGIAGWFIDEKSLHLGTMKTRATDLKFIVSPRPRTFSGKVAVLVDEHTASTSEIFAGGMQDLGRARIFGRRTMGAALPSVFEVLPNGDRFQYAMANYISSGGNALEGDGVTPDEVIVPTREQMLRGEDPVMDAAVRWIRTPEKS